MGCGVCGWVGVDSATDSWPLPASYSSSPPSPLPPAPSSFPACAQCPFVGFFHYSRMRWLLPLNAALQAANGLAHATEVLAVALRAPHLLPAGSSPASLILRGFIGSLVAFLVACVMDGSMEPVLRALGLIRGRGRQRRRLGLAPGSAGAAAADNGNDHEDLDDVAKIKVQAMAASGAAGTAASFSAPAVPSATTTSAGAARQGEGDEAAAASDQASLECLLAEGPSMGQGTLRLHLPHVNPSQLPEDWLARLQTHLQTR